MALPDRLATGAIAVIAAVSMAQADGNSGFLSRAVELPAHRWLAEIRRTPGAPLADFTTDGCSGGMSSLWTFTAEQFPDFAAAHGGIPPWEGCCVTHDRAYHTAGESSDPEASYAARLSADEALKDCVAATSGSRDAILRDEYGLTATQVRTAYGAIATAMFQAVRLGGGPCTGLPWRWGYGWPQCWQAQ